MAHFEQSLLPGLVAHPITCLVSDACLTADPGVASSIQARSHTVLKIDHENFSTVILLPSLELFKKVVVSYKRIYGAQRLSGSVLDLRPRGRRFQPASHGCVLEQDTLALA